MEGSYGYQLHHLPGSQAGLSFKLGCPWEEAGPDILAYGSWNRHLSACASTPAKPIPQLVLDHQLSQCQESDSGVTSTLIYFKSFLSINNLDLANLVWRASSRTARTDCLKKKKKKPDFTFLSIDVSQ